MLNASPASIAETNWKFVNQVKTNTPGRPRYPNSVNEALSLTELKVGVSLSEHIRILNVFTKQIGSSYRMQGLVIRIVRINLFG